MYKANLSDLELELWLRNRNSDSIYWETKNGDKIPIKEMSNNHLVNIINILNNLEEIRTHIEDL